jgi:nicotinate-nucleotide pyrophosphorylase (carboxylating)
LNLIAYLFKMIDFNSDFLKNQISQWLLEDVGSGDYSSLASIDKNATAESKLILKDNGVVAGLELAKVIFNCIDPSVQINVLASDGVYYEKGTILATATGNAQALLKGERLMLNLMQRLSGIATQTKVAVDIVEGTGVKLLDTRKTTPGLRHLEKWAVTMGGGFNHRIGLYDMIMLKDNHIDSSGGITTAVNRTKQYLKENNLNLKIGEQCETEASGGITLVNLKEYALSGVTYISLGYFTHSVKALDISFKTKLKN